MKCIQLFLLSGILLGLNLSVKAEHVSDPTLVAKGAKLYSDNCGRCHNPRPASEYSKKEWSVVMPHMREKAHMTGKESLAVEAFLASTLTADVKQDAQHDPDKPVRSGEELVAQFGCQGCHQMKGSGGNLGPSLDDVVANKGLAFVLKKLKNPKFNNAASAMPRFPMSDVELKAIAEYIGQN